MKLYSLSNDPNKPCLVLTFNEVTMMLDCGLSVQSVLSFLPLSFVPSSRLLNLANWVPPDAADPELEGELKECCDQVFVDSPPEFCPPLDKLVDFSQVDVILISNYLCMMALPFITEGTGFKGKVYATEPTLQIGRLFLEELVLYIEQCPKATLASHWKQVLHKLPPRLADGFKPRSWKRIYKMANVNASLARIQMVGYNEKIDIYGALQVIPVSSGFCLGSSNWIISSNHEKIAYVSGSSTLTTHPKPMDQAALRNADVLIMTGLTQTPISNPDSMLGMLCMVVSMTLRANGNVLIPCYPSGVVYDLFECLSTSLNAAQYPRVPMFFISPVADTSLAYSNILAEWLSTAKQNKVYIPDEPFPHGSLVKSNRLKQFKHIYSDGFSTDFREPCIVFCGHPSLRFGDAVHFIELWGSDPKNTIVFTEPDFDYLEALAPFQPLKMKAAHCAIDTSLNFMQANKLIKDLKPSALVIPECYTQPPASASHRPDLIIESTSDRPLITFKRGDVINLPLKRKHNQVFVNDSIAEELVPIEIKPGISLSSITGTLQVKDNVLNMQEAVSTSCKSKTREPRPGGSGSSGSGSNGSNLNAIKPLKNIQYEWGTLNVGDFVQKLAQEGITDAKVEPSNSGVIIHLPDADTLIQVEEHCTHVFCEGDQNLRLRLRNILMQCLRKF